MHNLVLVTIPPAGPAHLTVTRSVAPRNQIERRTHYGSSWNLGATANSRMIEKIRARLRGPAVSGKRTGHEHRIRTAEREGIRDGRPQAGQWARLIRHEIQAQPGIRLP